MKKKNALTAVLKYFDSFTSLLQLYMSIDIPYSIAASLDHTEMNAEY
jgi:hypothetical protein